jgi:hypothetical protein
MGARFHWSNQTNGVVYDQQIHFGGYGLCYQMGGGKSILDQHDDNYCQILLWVHFD